MDHDHQGPKDVHSNGDKALFTLGAVILDGERERITKHSIALGKRHTVLLEVCRILLWVKNGGHEAIICMLYIHRQAKRPGDHRVRPRDRHAKASLFITASDSRRRDKSLRKIALTAS